MRKFSSRSAFADVGSKGCSVVDGRYMYSGGGLAEESSSCRNVGIDSGGIGMASGMGDGSGPSCLDFDDAATRSILRGVGRSFEGRTGMGFSSWTVEPVAALLDDALRRIAGVECVRLVAVGRLDSDIVLSFEPV